MRFHHYALEVHELEEAIAFYKNYCGFQEEGRLSYMDEEIVFLISKNFRLELIFGPQQNEGTTHLCFEVDDLPDVMKKLDDRTRIEGPYKLPNGWETVFYEGPNQEIIEFLQTF
ncbi:MULTISPECIES: VOC family protein [Neobacillus]|uniref:Glyoxalase/bleomycin resistance/dioxygenase family protein n=1 Tax=Neobacillus rhizophilus TaxID=2833579 RepID=A0A942UD78_9BACI|nr:MULTISPECIES: VOC family protein [Neobacillus]MBS4216528.1 glyoxalase/bleomycin resistance/dioxygenase family protein [Neobacillus rhizophilus]MBU8919671.1 glyoxalase/bleomycin resistance/dioxygenase family protein [Bacillus sp. FJAT-29953]